MAITRSSTACSRGDLPSEARFKRRILGSNPQVLVDVHRTEAQAAISS